MRFDGREELVCVGVPDTWGEGDGVPLSVVDDLCEGAEQRRYESPTSVNG